MTANIITINWQSLCYSDYNIVIILFWQNNECLHHVDSGFDLLRLNQSNSNSIIVPSLHPEIPYEQCVSKTFLQCHFANILIRTAKHYQRVNNSCFKCFRVVHILKKKKKLPAHCHHMQSTGTSRLKKTCSWQLEWFCVTTDFQ